MTMAEYRAACREIEALWRARRISFASFDWWLRMINGV